MAGHPRQLRGSHGSRAEPAHLIGFGGDMVDRAALENHGIRSVEQSGLSESALP
jgi:hypothetical protein